MYSTVVTFFNLGGPFMWVILIILAVAGAVALERLIYYFIYCSVNSQRILKTLSTALYERKPSETWGFLNKRKTPLYRMLSTAMERFSAGAPILQIEEGIEEVSIKELPKLSQRLSYLSLFANIATLVGLLGTIAGLQQSFGSLASADAAEKAAMLSAGIAQAMNTTAFGLIVAVPCMVLYTMFANRQQALLNDIDDTVVRVVNIMKTIRC